MNGESMSATITAPPGEGIGARLAGKYMTFKLAEENYGLEILKVKEIIGLLEITAVPRTAPYVRGVINLRGKVIPVVDLRMKFGMECVEETDQSVIIVVQYALDDSETVMGILVDEVLEVLDIPPDQIEPTPSFGDDAAPIDFLKGIGKSNTRVVLLLDIASVLSREGADINMADEAA